MYEQLSTKIAQGPRPGPLRVDRTLGQMPDFRAMKKEHEIREVEETVAALKARGIKATVVVEAD